MDHDMDHAGDHENMHFEMLRLDDSENLVHVDIARDLSDYDEEGNDPGPKRSAVPDGAEQPHQ